MDKIKGYLYASMAAVAYGTNPAFAVPLYEDGMNANSVLLLRYILGLPFLAFLMIIRGKKFKLDGKSLGQTFVLGVLMAFSSLALFESYNYMNSGVASTLLFVYPIMVALIMGIFFHEKFRASIFLCLIIMSGGVVLLMKPGEGANINSIGCLLVMISALTYALYIVMVNVSKRIKEIPTTQLLFYVLLWGSLVFLLLIPMGADFTVPQKTINWINIIALAVIPTVLSLAFTTRAIQLVGSTPTAILGALEPVTAVVLSVVILHQGLTLNEISGGLLIVIATLIVISNKRVDKVILQIRKMFPTSH